LFSHAVERVGLWFATRPPHTRVLLVLATCILIGELVLRRFAPKSRFYKGWTHAFETLGLFWTAIILSIVYFFSVSIVALFMRLAGRDLLDRGIAQEASFWKTHEPNPLGPRAAVRHQF
jgi:Saxitoxin biosynthesis operon protein SxtJ